ncbi:transposase [Streptomyces sp. NPDC101455]|uniref:transposase n=1 Tax=Streptomyces sp. NPDC101455 TaxID=3366142 RepID=UPI00382935E0
MSAGGGTLSVSQPEGGKEHCGPVPTDTLDATAADRASGVDSTSQEHCGPVPTDTLDATAADRASGVDSTSQELGQKPLQCPVCATRPVPASSDRTNRHRLSCGGDRQANAAFYRIALVRMSSDPRTRAYVTRQTAAGRTKKEIIRLLKRAVAREMFRCLTTTVTVPHIADLRPLRQSKNLTLTAAARHFSLWPTAISALERGIRRDDDLAHAYRNWLQAA